jgi:chromosome partitioning protein
MSKIIAIANEKGGTGKTTSSVNLGAGLQRQGKRVLLCDNDPQGNLTMSLGFEPEQLTKTLSDLMLEKIKDDNCTFNKSEYILEKEGLHILPSDIRLSAVDNSLVNALSREYILRDILNEYRSDFDYILIDCLPSLGMLTINALAAADSLIIPVQAQFLSLKGLELLLNTVSRVRRQINRSLSIDGILLTMYNSRTNLSREVKKAVEDSYGSSIRIFSSVISYSVKAAEPTVYGESIFTHDPNGAIAGAYLDVVKEMLCNE